MSERVLADPLSGEEILTAVAEKIKSRLRRDCYLTPNMAYQSFRCKIKIELVAVDCGEERPVNVEESVSLNPDDAALDQADKELAEFEIEPAPPNDVRVETEQPVPILTKDVDGRPTVRHAKYGKKHLKAAGE
jgi:hypothetical protein